jgi:hypothetical protein
MSKKYDGEPLDMSWQTAPWNNDGETIEAYDSSGDGEIMTVDWPENATDREMLNSNQQKIILTAAKYPDINNPDDILERSGLDMSDKYPNNVLRKHWPERYWGKTKGYANPNINSGRDADENDVNQDVEEIRQRILNGETLREVARDYPVCKDTVSNVVRGKVSDLPESEIPPLRWQNEGEQGWKVPSESETAGEQERETDSTMMDTGTHSATPDPVRHTPEPESSSLPAWVWAVVGAVFAWIVLKILG